MIKIGILGGGQLARMILEGCYKFGIEFHILSKEENSPAGQLTKDEMVGDWNSDKCLDQFASSCDIITLENEFIDYKRIKLLEEMGKKVYPCSEIIKLVQDKLFQKQTLEKNNIPVANFTSVTTPQDVLDFVEQNRYPVILKSRTMGYDGKGNYKIDSEKDILKAMQSLSMRGELMCESFVNFKKEIATQVVRNKDGEVRVYPVVETIQQNYVCDLVLASHKIFSDISDEVNEIAKKIMDELDYIGVMGIEMFLTSEKKLLVNELAPRVHNSGHYTIEGCYTSQFENHVRAIMNWPLGNVEMKTENAVLKNILSRRNGPARINGIEKILSHDKTYIHIYGKKTASPGRKLGHITVLNEDLQNAIDTANYCRDIVDI